MSPQPFDCGGTTVVTTVYRQGGCDGGVYSHMETPLNSCSDQTRVSGCTVIADEDEVTQQPAAEDLPQREQQPSSSTSINTPQKKKIRLTPSDISVDDRATSSICVDRSVVAPGSAKEIIDMIEKEKKSVKLLTKKESSFILSSHKKKSQAPATTRPTANAPSPPNSWCAETYTINTKTVVLSEILSSSSFVAENVMNRRTGAFHTLFLSLCNPQRPSALMLELGDGEGQESFVFRASDSSSSLSFNRWRAKPTAAPFSQEAVVFLFENELEKKIANVTVRCGSGSGGRVELRFSDEEVSAALRHVYGNTRLHDADAVLNLTAARSACSNAEPKAESDEDVCVSDVYDGDDDDLDKPRNGKDEL